MVAEIRLVDLLQRRPLHRDRILIGRAKGVRGDGAECALDVGAGDLAGDVGQRDALDAGRLEIGRDIRNRFMQRDHE